MFVRENVDVWWGCILGCELLFVVCLLLLSVFVLGLFISFWRVDYEVFIILLIILFVDFVVDFVNFLIWFWSFVDVLVIFFVFLFFLFMFI